MKATDTNTAAPAASSPIDTAKAALAAAFPGGAIIVTAFVAAPTETRSGKSKKDGTPYKMSTTAAVIGGKFAQLTEFSRDENAKQQRFTPGLVVVQARAVEKDPKNPAISRIALSDIEDAAL